MIGELLMGVLVNLATGGEWSKDARPCLACGHPVHIVKYAPGRRHPVCLGCAGRPVTS